jgi:hypothetical protein
MCTRPSSYLVLPPVTVELQEVWTCPTYYV